MTSLAAIPTAALIAELLDRKTRRLATVANIDRAIGGHNNFQLADARRAMDVAEAISHETNGCPVSEQTFRRAARLQLALVRRALGQTAARKAANSLPPDNPKTTTS